MPRKIAYKNPDGTIGYFNDWTEDVREAMAEDRERKRNDPVFMEEDRKRRQKFIDKIEWLKKNKPL